MTLDVLRIETKNEVETFVFCGGSSNNEQNYDMCLNFNSDSNVTDSCSFCFLVLGIK
jgi:hypothetical protein